MYKPTSCMNQLISCIPVGLLSSIMVLLNPFQGSVDTLVVYPGILPGLILLNPFKDGKELMFVVKKHDS